MSIYFLYPESIANLLVETSHFSPPVLFIFSVPLQWPCAKNSLPTLSVPTRHFPQSHLKIPVAWNPFGGWFSMRSFLLQPCGWKIRDPRDPNLIWVAVPLKTIHQTPVFFQEITTNLGFQDSSIFLLGGDLLQMLMGTKGNNENTNDSLHISSGDLSWTFPGCLGP